MTQIELFRDFFKKKGVGALFTRRELLKYFSSVGGLTYYKSSGAVSVDTNIAYLRYAGYVRREAYGVTKILKLIPDGYSQADIYKEGRENRAAEKAVKPKVTTESIAFAPHEISCEALSTQVGGTHYKDLKIQPIVLIMKGGFSFVQGNIIKYLSRYKHKNGIEDLKKCIQYAQFGIDLGERPGRVKRPELIEAYCQANDFTGYVQWTLNQVCARKWDRVIEGCNILIREYAEEQTNVKESSTML